MPESEAGFQRAVIDLAHLRGWMVAHFRPAQLGSGRWATPMQGDPGFPDIVAARAGRVIFAELKSEGGTMSAAQRAWEKNLLGDAPRDGQTHEVYVWRPSHWDFIEEALR